MAAAYLEFAVQERPLFEVAFGAGLDKTRHPELQAAGARVLQVLLGPAEELRPGDGPSLLVAVAALAHGYAVFVHEGALPPPSRTQPHVRERLAAASSPSPGSDTALARRRAALRVPWTDRSGRSRTRTCDLTRVKRAL